MTEPSHMGAIHDGRAAYSPKQFEKAFGISHTKLYELIGSGQLIARKIGKRTIILAEEAEVWARSLPVIATVKP